MTRARWFVLLVIAGVLGASLFVGAESGAVSGTLFSCSNSAPVAGFGTFSPGVKKTETSQTLHAKYSASDCVADGTQLQNALPAKHGVSASQAAQINRAFLGIVWSSRSDCLVNGVTTGGDPDTTMEYSWFGKLGIKWEDSSGIPIGTVGTSSAYVHATYEAAFPPRLDFSGTVIKGLGIGGDISGSLQLDALPGDTSVSDCFLNGDPGAIVTKVQVTSVNNLTITLANP